MKHTQIRVVQGHQGLSDLKTIYQASDEHKDITYVGCDREMGSKYPSIQRWAVKLDVISPMFKCSAQVRKVIYTTNAIESLNSGYGRLNRQRSVFPSRIVLLKALYLATFELTKRWTCYIVTQGSIHGELSIMYPDRLD